MFRWHGMALGEAQLRKAGRLDTAAAHRQQVGWPGARSHEVTLAGGCIQADWHALWGPKDGVGGAGGPSPAVRRSDGRHREVQESQEGQQPKSHGPRAKEPLS